ncbi:hypothetical protein CDL12_18872 [Handroanthus impetiginosus]|uniref:MULE transposase domain-containing protein n=1 Tax=Handroanthus impetiginosus TaxID=429701 RepID=A0A2G9GTE1_9LAMI|nr:hypothetical protein CDL12_18872 [Handroanthus impetiginosus]
MIYMLHETYLLRSQHNMTKEHRILFNTTCNSGVPPARAFGLMQNLAGGEQNLGFTQSEVFSELTRQKRKKKINSGDAVGLNMEVESDITLINIFFRDSRCFVDYESFGDVLSFDTTYKTKKYGLKCAPFVEINHHKENIMFGFALISDETESSFKWLFRTFLESMAGKQPQLIITDQCQAMINAIRTVFPTTHYRLCQWHINQNAPSHFESLNTNSGFKHLWTKCMSYYDHIEAFEARWQLMVENYNIIFSNHIFSCGLMATSRSEGTNTALKKAIGNATSSLLDCVHGYEKILSNCRSEETKKGIHCHHTQLALLAHHNPLLKYATEVYTHNIFHLFQNELKDSFNFECMEEPTYPISSLRRVYTQANLKNIPERYILKRWTKTAKNMDHTEPSENASGRSCSVNRLEMAFVSHATKKIHDLAMRYTPYGEARYILT